MRFLIGLILIGTIVCASARPTFDKIAEVLLDIVDEHREPHSYSHPHSHPYPHRPSHTYAPQHHGAYEQGYHYQQHYGAQGGAGGYHQHLDVAYPTSGYYHQPAGHPQAPIGYVPPANLAYANNIHNYEYEPNYQNGYAYPNGNQGGNYDGPQQTHYLRNGYKNAGY